MPNRAIEFKLQDDPSTYLLPIGEKDDPLLVLQTLVNDYEIGGPVVEFKVIEVGA